MDERLSIDDRLFMRTNSLWLSDYEFFIFYMFLRMKTNNHCNKDFPLGDKNYLYNEFLMMMSLYYKFTNKILLKIIEWYHIFAE
jgi:hypothetical protein